jgi:hypothetical protein
LKNLFLLLFTIAIISSCSKSTIVLMPDYNGKEIKQATLAIAPFEKPPKIINEDDLIDDYGEGDKNEIFQKLLDDKFVYSLKKNSTFKEISFTKFKDKVSLDKVTLSLDEENKIDFQLPKNSEQVEFESFEADYVLFIKDWIVSRDGSHDYILKSEPDYSKPNIPGQSNHPKLQMNLKFLFWDNNEHKIVLYGETTSEESVTFFSMTESTWEYCLNNLSKQIIEDSPFAKTSRAMRK